MVYNGAVEGDVETMKLHPRCECASTAPSMKRMSLITTSSCATPSFINPSVECDAVKLNILTSHVEGWTNCFRRVVCRHGTQSQERERG